MSRSIAIQPDMFAAYYLPMSEAETDLRQVAVRARTAFRRLCAFVSRSA